MNTGYWVAANCVKLNPESEEKIMMYPAWGWGDVAKEYNPNAWGAGGSITRLSKVPDAAWLFNEYYTIEEPAIARAKTGWGVPTFKSLFQYMPQGTPWRKQLYDMIMQQAQSVLPPLEFGPYIMRSSMDAPFKKYNQMYLKGEISFDDMLTKFEADVNTAIADEMGRQS
jgi:multiple sugar transport system substrate-binding protein